MSDFFGMNPQEKQDVAKAVEALREWKRRIEQDDYDGGSKERVAELDQVIDYLTSILKRANEG